MNMPSGRSARGVSPTWGKFGVSINCIASVLLLGTFPSYLPSMMSISTVVAASSVSFLQGNYTVPVDAETATATARAEPGTAQLQQPTGGDFPVGPFASTPWPSARAAGEGGPPVLAASPSGFPSCSSFAGEDVERGDASAGSTSGFVHTLQGEPEPPNMGDASEQGRPNLIDLFGLRLPPQLEEELGSFLSELRLEHYLEPALKWCNEMGAWDLYEIVTEDLAGELADEMQLKPCERELFLSACQQVLQQHHQQQQRAHANAVANAEDDSQSSASNVRKVDYPLTRLGKVCYGDRTGIIGPDGHSLMEVGTGIFYENALDFVMNPKTL